MQTNRGAPTPPTAVAGDAAGVTGRLDRGRVGHVEVDDRLRQRLASTGADVDASADALSEASRDWWPLAMVWALDNQVAARASAVARAHSAAEVAEVLRGCNEARVPVTAAPGPSGGVRRGAPA